MSDTYFRDRLRSLRRILRLFPMALRLMRSSAVLAITLVAACAGGDYEINLPHGYVIARTQPGQFVLVAPDRHTVIIQGLRRYGVHGNIMFGETAVSPSGQPQLFVVDMEGKVVRKGLGLTEWTRDLQKRGVNDQTIRQPSPLDALWHR